MPFDYAAEPELKGSGPLTPGKNAVGISRYKRMKESRDRALRWAEERAARVVDLEHQLARTEADLTEARRTIEDLTHGDPL